MIKDITLGQYFPGKSAIHRLDPRTKLLGMIAYIVIVFIIKNTAAFLLPETKGKTLEEIETFFEKR